MGPAKIFLMFIVNASSNDGWSELWGKCVPQQQQQRVSECQRRKRRRDKRPGDCDAHTETGFPAFSLWSPSFLLHSFHFFSSIVKWLVYTSVCACDFESCHNWNEFMGQGGGVEKEVSRGRECSTNLWVSVFTFWGGAQINARNVNANECPCECGAHSHTHTHTWVPCQCICVCVCIPSSTTLAQRNFLKSC